MGTCAAREKKGDKKVLIVFTSCSKKGKVQLGYKIEHAAYLVSRLQTDGVPFDFASPKGGLVHAAGDVEAYRDKGDICVTSFLDLIESENTKNLNDCNSDDYAAIYFVGGLGVLEDLSPHARAQEITASIYERGGLVGAIGHGVGALLETTLPNGDLLLKGHSVAGPTDADDDEVVDDVAFSVHGKLNAEESAWSYKFVSGEGGFVQGNKKTRVITGQNDASNTVMVSTFSGALRKLRLKKTGGEDNDEKNDEGNTNKDEEE